MPRRLSGNRFRQLRNDPSRASSGRMWAPDRIPRFLRIPNLPLERGFIPTVAFGTHRNGRNRDSFAFRTAVLSWPGLSRPSVAARTGGDDPDEPGHDDEGTADPSQPRCG